MRALTLYLFVAIAAPIYGGQVCPFMEGLPVWEFESYVVLPALLIIAVRASLQPLYVNGAPLMERSSRQFKLDMGLFTLAGLTASLVLHLGPELPLWQPGLKLTLAFVTGGLFASLDLALAREREVIAEAVERSAPMPPPTKLTPRSRQFAAVAVAITVLAATVLTLVLVRDLNWLSQQSPAARDFGEMIRSVVIEVVLIVGVLLAFSVNLILSAARNMRTLFNMETSALESVSRGDLSVQVPVATQDELGYIAGVTNSMIERLRDHLRLQRGLEIAAEVQQNFLPESMPHVEGLSLAGMSRFCDETGGDFYDFIPRQEGVLAVVGDVVGHGLDAALLMASTRASIRQAAEAVIDPGDLLNAVNQQLCKDTEGSGRFVTCVIMQFDPKKRSVTWASAGHPASIRHLGKTTSFASLRGKDLPLGVEANWKYSTHETEWLKAGESIVLLSDGLTETQGEDGMFGDRRLEESIARNWSDSADEMAQGIMGDVLDHAVNGQIDDDATLVVVTGQ